MTRLTLRPDDLHWREVDDGSACRHLAFARVRAVTDDDRHARIGMSRAGR
jgi:hypothetical protein